MGACSKTSKPVPLRVPWQMTRKNLPALKRELAKLEIEGKSPIIIDLESVDTMDSAGLGFLLAARERLRKKGAVVSIENANPFLNRILYLVGNPPVQ